MIRSPKARHEGFTLIELAIVVVISGVIALILFEALAYRSEQQKRQITIDNINTMQAAISEYQGRQGYYPCPAPRNAPPGSALYGLAAANPGACTGTTLGSDYNHVANKVAIGAVPFATLAPFITYTKATNNLALDGWGNRLTYAVTLSQTAPAPSYNDANGGVSVHDENDKFLIVKPGTTLTEGGAHFVVLSHGDNGRGAYSKDGVPVQGCGSIIIPNPAPANTSSINEINNCNDQGYFLDGLRNLSQFSYNDDIVHYTVVQRSDLWSVNNFTNNILRIVNTNTRNVGVGVNPYALNFAPYNDHAERFNVLGPIQATNFQATTYCDQGGANSNCMPATSVGGADPAMDCSKTGSDPTTGTDMATWGHGPGTVITSIQSNHAVCGSGFATPVAKTCPSTTTVPPRKQFVVAVSSLGNLNCWDPVTNTITQY